jgi:hypothetical protein
MVDQASANAAPLTPREVPANNRTCARGLVQPKCQLVHWEESTYRRACTLVALSHECLVLDQLNIGCRSDSPAMIMGSPSRHHPGTQLASRYLLECGIEAHAVFLGESRHAGATSHKKVKRLQAKRQALDVPDLPCVDDA